jgi:hypothetical protein
MADDLRELGAPDEPRVETIEIRFSDVEHGMNTLLRVERTTVQAVSDLVSALGRRIGKFFGLVMVVATTDVAT